MSLGYAGWHVQRILQAAHRRVTSCPRQATDADTYIAYHSRDRATNVFEHGVAPETRFFEILAQMRAPRVLEIGSRRIVAPLNRGRLPADASYVGLDITPGPNVDVVGDAHQLSTLFAAGSFDAVLSYAVFEHIAMPWRVALEINRILSPKGLVYIASHHAYPTHELPWDFWRFGHDALATIFGESQGFERLGSSLRHSARVVPPRRPMRYDAARERYLFADVLATKVGEPDAARFAWDVDYRDALPAGHFYPKGTSQLVGERTAEDDRDRQCVVPDVVTADAMHARLRALLPERGHALVVTARGSRGEGEAVPSGWTTERLRVDGPEGARVLDALPRERFDAIVSADVLSAVAHPWRVAPALASALKVGGHLLARELATGGHRPGEREYWRFTSESLRIVYHPTTTGLAHRGGGFAQPLVVVPDAWRGKPPEILTAKAFAHAYGLFRKERPGALPPGARWALG